jgi:hypothetical protein
MADAIFIKSRNEQQVTILNQPSQAYDLALWEQLKTRLSLSDQELANRLNNQP